MWLIGEVPDRIRREFLLRLTKGSNGISTSLRQPLYVGVACGSPCVAPHHGLVRRRSHRYGLLGESPEGFSSAPRIPSVETKREFIQVVVEVLPADRTLVGAQQPPLQQRGYQMNARQQVRRRFLPSLQEGDTVPVALSFQGIVSRPAVGMNQTAGLNGVLHKGHEALS